jgi:hypothetical protein
MAALREALQTAREVPREFIEVGKATFAWHNIDADLAALTYDSALEESPALAHTREEPALLRNLTFTSTDLTIELEITSDALLGQLVPPQPGEVEVIDAARHINATAIDELGSFLLRPVPSKSFRLHLRPSRGPAVLTGWIAPSGTPPPNL